LGFTLICMNTVAISVCSLTCPDYAREQAPACER